MRRTLIILCIGIFVGSCISISCGHFFKKHNKMFWPKEDITLELNSKNHILNRDDEKVFLKRITIPQGSCLNYDGECGEFLWLKLSLVIKRTDVRKYFNEGKIEGPYFINYGLPE